MLRIFLYKGQIDESFKQTARQSLIEAKWNPVLERNGPVQLLTCSGPDRRACNLSPDSPYAYAIIAERP